MIDQAYRFKALKLKAKEQVYRLLAGNSLSKLHGEGYDFSELREYQIGDDVRKINWIITAKMGKPYIKELYEAKELSICVSAFMSPSLYFGEQGSGSERLKQELLAQIVMLLSYATQHNGDLFRGVYFLGRESYATPPTKEIYAIDKFCEEIHKCDPLYEELDVTSAVDELFGRVERRSLLILVGDFLEEFDFSLLAQKHEVVVVIIRHHEERELPKLAEVMLHDPHTRANKDIFIGKKSIESYRAKQLQHDAKLAEHFARYGIRYTTIYTDEEPVVKLARLFG